MQLLPRRGFALLLRHWNAEPPGLPCSLPFLDRGLAQGQVRLLLQLRLAPRPAGAFGAFGGLGLVIGLVRHELREN